MKYRLFAILLAFVLLLSMTACSAAGAARSLDAAEDRVEEKLDAVEDTVENAIRNAVAPAPASTQSAPAPSKPASTASAPTQAAAALTKEDAEKVALDYAGFTADQVQRLRTEYEIDDGIRQYDVQFYEGDWEYEFEISAEDGRILSYDKDHKYD